MRLSLTKFFNHWTLLAVNILIIVAVEATGTYFARTGFIHLLAVAFVILGLSRALAHVHVYDQFLEPVIHRGIFAMIILAASHLYEYTGFRYFDFPRATISANVVNFYLTGLIIIILGLESFLGKLKKTPTLMIPFLKLNVIFFPLLVLVFFSNPQLVNLNPDSWQVYAYSFISILIPAIGIWRLSLLKHVSIMVSFINYFIAGFILIGASAVISTLEEVISNFGVPFLQIIFINHFLFYGALSLFYLAYERLIHLGGIYDDLEKLKAKI